MIDPSFSSHLFMQRALELAEQGRGRTAPNPPVGAVIVKDGQIVGEGFHPKAGMPHAEVYALEQAGAKAQGADVYVTLEPCSHTGRTPPCARALIAAGIRRVFVAVIDPDPRVSGAGITLLREAGIQVTVGLGREQAAELLAGFSKHLRCGHPWTIYKAAMTLDGHTATAVGDSRWISCEESRLRVHRLRNRVEAIMVGIETVLKDDPQLNVRLPGEQSRDPLRVVVDSRLRFPLTAKMLAQDSPAATLIATCCDDKARISALTAAGAEVLVLPADEAGRVPLQSLWDELGRRNVQYLLLEGGSTLATSAWNACLIDELMVFVAPRLVGGCPTSGLFSGVGAILMADSAMLEDVRHETSGSDLLIRAKVQTCLLD
ncbi:bifunctional diaminohydroxyphosphoribosylaminopyrimidine deaminase/5-amino-6-(5-phosphoribosylamino)uracil reductase RibD [Pelovirga terrestris]|uniref:Riboflavin biosynthesis protein RibD n=1 Tax=Pelovirga terrestris TaxID=2771352 RepID=A0A8J6QTT8_9BACT|nr:bifunctional diaminohydroxyphosphoribosylaminopyrimidine deaminase/5-amino-6-(5-phosphoribosylamino)uracil reductase RibD [Pelovirga terrestris]MBD1399605.1 bifunctional diaminohydroxyphosphoribosylaminopyrimidine deaminase/5-amino-6-(5-phosphoribosylamino)uracil reductase RibD [Pelovirga terrestris]